MNAKKPFNPQKWPFFYGYWIVLCSIIGMVFSVPGQTVGVSVFTDFLLENLEIKRLTFSAAYMVGTIASGLVIGKVGRLLDSVGSRVMAALASAGLGIVLLVFSQIDVLARGVYDFVGLGYGVVVTVVLTLSFFLLRFSGQGILSLASGTMILRWFVRKRGRINGIAGIFISLMFAGAPLALDGLIQQFGWRGAYVNLAVYGGVGMTVLILIFYRDNPRTMRAAARRRRRECGPGSKRDCPENRYDPGASQKDL